MSYSADILTRDSQHSCNNGGWEVFPSWLHNDIQSTLKPWTQQDILHKEHDDQMSIICDPYRYFVYDSSLVGNITKELSKYGVNIYQRQYKQKYEGLVPIILLDESSEQFDLLSEDHYILKISRK